MTYSQSSSRSILAATGRAKSTLGKVILTMFFATAAAVPLGATTLTEADLGDFGASISGQRVFALQEGITTISGSLNGQCSVGPGPSGALECLSISGDFSDRFGVSVSDSLQLDFVLIDLDTSSDVGAAFFDVVGLNGPASVAFGGALAGLPLPFSGNTLDLGITFSDLTGADLVEGIPSAGANYSYTFNVSAVPVSEVPLPAGFGLLLFGLLPFWGLRKTRNG